MSHVALSMTFSNNTFDTWYRDYYGYQDQKGLSGPQQLPGPVLQANSGLETMSMAQSLSALDQGPLVIYLCWLGPQGYRIGVRMKADFQMLGIGKRPYWETMCDQNPPGSVPQWQGGEMHANPYTWTCLSGLSISVVGRPVSEHTSLSVEVSMTGL